MLGENARLWGVRTNNLKNIDIEIKHGCLNLIVGPSGSGKSSLAYDTISQIGLQEYLSMCAEGLEDSCYKVDGYSGMLATVPLKQSCSNTNTHSTIGTYFGLNRELILVFSSLLSVDEGYFVLNKACNLCPTCHGLGVLRSIDKNKIVDYNVPLRRNPLKCWNRHVDFFKQIIMLYCQDQRIDPDKTFRTISKAEQDKLLRGESDKKFSVRYKKVNRLASRTTCYYGPLTGKLMLPDCSIGGAFYTDVTCPTCGGKRYAPDHESVKLEGLSFGSVLVTPFEGLETYLLQLLKNHKDEHCSDALKHIIAFVRKANELNLGHLNLNRGIPTLSGGELQRLRLAQIFNTQLTNLMVILDEPLAGVSAKEKEAIYSNVVGLVPKQTVIVVDHGQRFRKVAKHIIALGNGGGASGGHVIDSNKYFSGQEISAKARKFTIKSSVKIRVENDVYGYKGAIVEIPMEGMTLLSGRSGVGKSVLLREFLPLYFDSYDYVSQKLLLGGRQSCVATALNIATQIEELYAKRFSKAKQFFSKQIGCEGACPACNGYGYQEISGLGIGKGVVCRECNGTGFERKLEKFKINGKGIADVWGMTVDEAVDFLSKLNFKGIESLELARQLLLGHLMLGQYTGTLSGGENIRVKLLRAYRSKVAVLGVDEPFRGLDKKEVSKVIEYLYALNEKGMTIVVVDHTEGIENFFARHLEVVNNRGYLCALPILEK